jgi:predicted transcriptional regulator
MPDNAPTLTEKRTALGLSRSDLARSAGLSETVVARIESDERQASERPISMRRLQEALAKAGLTRPTGRR